MKLHKFFAVSKARSLKTTLLSVPLLVFGEIAYPADLNVTCVGDELGVYDFPMTQPIVVTNKMQRLALPLQAILYDQDLNIVTPSALTDADGEYHPPVVQVWFVSDGASESPCVNEDLECLDPYDLDSVQLNDAYPGNEFVYKDPSHEWHFNLAVGDYSATGTYTVTMKSGNSSLYEFSDTNPDPYVYDPATCTGTFIRESVDAGR